MRKTIIPMVAIAAFMMSTTTQAQEPVFGGHNIPRMVEGESLKPAGSFYFGGYSGSHEFSSYRVHIYEFRVEGSIVSEKATWSPWAVRLTGSGTQQRVVEWADGRTCPGLYSVQIALSDFPAARVRPPRHYGSPAGTGSTPSPGLTLGAPSLAIWGYARLADGAPGTVMVTGADGLIRQWVDFADAQLHACWRETPPAGIATREMLGPLPPEF